MDRPLPALYTCYLLRSTVRHASLYVGSTPNPVRRLRQHNGKSKGGAVRTSKDSLRPWEMTCLVTGFPSKIAALQFEWAWQNTHLTRHIPAAHRTQAATSRTKFSPRTGRVRKRPNRPRYSLSDKLINLHLLLRASSFDRWPLRVRFFAEDVWKAWGKCTEKFFGRDGLRKGIQMELEEEGIEGLEIGYAGSKRVVEKGRERFGEGGESGDCGVCQAQCPEGGAATVVCSAEGCDMVAHVGCLSDSFLVEEGNEVAIVPTQGHCPACKTQLQWVNLIKELTLRMRGEKEIAALFKKPKGKKGKAAASDAEWECPDEEPLPEEDVWNLLVESSDVEPDASGGAAKSDPSPHQRFLTHPERSKGPASGPIIDESDWEEAKVLT